jgi:hypothetical protein
MIERLQSFIKAKNKRLLINGFIREKRSDARYGLRRIKRWFHLPKKQYQGKLNFDDQLDRIYGKHRSGWNYALNCLSDLQNPKGITLDTFIEKTFAWYPKKILSHTKPWVGFTHVPPGVPKWLLHEQSNVEVFKTEAWKISYPWCKGLFTLSEYHKKYLQTILDIPVESLLHPTEFPDMTWNWEQFYRNPEKKIIQIGWWLRKLYSIYFLPVTKYKKIFLRKNDIDIELMLKKEYENMEGKERLTEDVMSSVINLDFIPNRKYDRMLSENIVFLDLYDSSANNGIIECIARNTPLLVNPLEPVIEYLGKDYPLYFSSLEEASQKAMNLDLVRDAHTYLVHHPYKYKFTGEYFRDSLINSNIYRKI